MIKIRETLPSDFDLLTNLPPKEWNLDLPGFLSLHYGYPYFYSVVAEIDGVIAGFGNGILNCNVGWLGNIIVLPSYRNQGIGATITNRLVDYFKDKGCTSQLLIASKMGKHIYCKVGFSVVSSYLFYKPSGKLRTYKISSSIRKTAPQDFPSIQKMDKEVSGEDRFPFVSRFLHDSFVYEDPNGIEGFYLPQLGGGLIIANIYKAGIDLLKLKLNEGKTTVVVPVMNRTASTFLKSEGFQLQTVAPRMLLGNDVSWKPKFIFSRGAGYCG